MKVRTIKIVIVVIFAHFIVILFIKPIKLWLTIAMAESWHLNHSSSTFLI